MSFLRDARRPEPLAHIRGQLTRRIRERLPGGVFWYMRLRRSMALPTAPSRGTAVCQVRMRHFTDGMELTLEPWRASSIHRPGGPRRRPERPRSHHRGRWLHRRARWGSDRGQRSLGAEAQRRGRHRCRGLHRVRGLCGGLPQHLGSTVTGEPRLPIWGSCHRVNPSAIVAQSEWLSRWTRSRLATARGMASVRRPVRKRISIDVIARMNRDYLHGGR